MEQRCPHADYGICVLLEALCFTGLLATTVACSSVTRSEQERLLGTGVVPSVVDPKTMFPSQGLPSDVMYLSDLSGKVLIYPRGAGTPSPIGEIGGFPSNEPWALAVDSNLNLYAAVLGEGSAPAAILVFPPGATKPTKTYTAAVFSPVAITLDKTDTLYVANSNGPHAAPGIIAVYPPGVTQPERFLSYPGIIGFYGVAVNDKGDVYGSYQSTNGSGGVVEFAHSAIAHDLGIHAEYAGNIALDDKDNLLFADQFVPGIRVYEPHRRLLTRILAPGRYAGQFALGVLNQHLFVPQYFSGSSGIASVYDYRSGSLLKSYTSGLYDAAAVAVAPPAFGR